MCGTKEPYNYWTDLIPDDERLKYLIDPNFEYPLNQTNYTKKYLEALCYKKSNRKQFELSSKYRHIR